MSYECFDVTTTDKVAHVQMKRGGKDPVEEGRRNANLRLKAMHLQDTFSCLEQARMPVLAAIQGGCIGGGVDMVTACDMRYATADAWFCIQEINIGMTADVGTLQRLPKIIPEGVARELAYTGDRMSAERAQAVGLVNEVFATHEDLIAGVLEIAGRIAAKSPLAVWGTKESINFTRDHSVADSLKWIATWQAGMFRAPDMVKSFEGMQNKETPSYDDLPAVERNLD